MCEKAAIVLTALAMAFGVLAPAASAGTTAHQVIHSHGDDWARVTADHFSITVTDAECDNHGVYAGYVTSGGNFYTLGDPDGCEVRSGHTYSPDNTQIASFYVCERSVGCSTTKFVT